MGLIEIEHHPSRRQLVTFGAIWLLFFGAAGLWAARNSDSRIAPSACWIAAALVPAGSNVNPASPQKAQYNDLRWALSLCRD